MKTLSLVTFLTATVLLPSCASVKSDISYRKGTDKLWEGDVDQAIAYLREAVEFDPTAARNHYHLAMAYQRKGDIPRAWEQIRHAYALDTESTAQLQVFTRLYNQLSDQHRLEKGHPVPAKVVEVLGVGDKYLHDEQGQLQAIYYGPLCLRFEQGRLSASEWHTFQEPDSHTR